MSYVASSLRIPHEHANGMARVLDYLRAQGRVGATDARGLTRVRPRTVEPFVFGPYVTCALLNRRTPAVMDVLVDVWGTHVAMPSGWSRIPTDEAVMLDGDAFTLKAYDWCSVPGVIPTVRLFMISGHAYPDQLVDIPPLGAEQVAYDGNKQRKPVYSKLFKENLWHKVVSVAREDTYKRPQLRTVQERGVQLSLALGFKGLARLHKKTADNPPSP